MRTIVSKFGGSSTANAAQFNRILSIIRAAPARRCIVLSAPGIDEGHGEKITAILSECWQWRGDAARLEALIAKVADRFSAIASDLSLPGMGELVRRELDGALAISEAHTLSRGEYLCALLFSRFSGIPMIDATEVIAFDAYGDIDATRTRRQLLAVAGAGQGRLILPGFYGAGPAGEIRTFPRNGSDITGALAAASLEAGLYENWTDVPGLMTADPTIVPRARLINQISYRQMRMLSRAGAQVLHPACLDPVAMSSIPTRLRCTMRPDCFGTLIDDNTARDAPCVVGRRDAGGTACISLFGMNEARAQDAVSTLNPLRSELVSGAYRVYVRPDALEDAVRYLHQKLIEENAM